MVNGHSSSLYCNQIIPSTRADGRRTDCCFRMPASASVAAHDMPAMDEEHPRRGSLLSGALHRHSVGALTSRAAFPVTAFAWKRQ